MESVERKIESVERKKESVEGKWKVLKRKCKVLKATNRLDLSCHETTNITLQLIVKTGFHFYLFLSILQLEKKRNIKGTVFVVSSDSSIQVG